MLKCYLRKKHLTGEFPGGPGGEKKHRTQRQIPQGRYWIVYNALCGRITCKSNYYVTYMNTHIYAYLNILSIYGLMK